MAFRDRKDAGRRLAALCRPYREPTPLVLGLARGGIPVAAEVAEALGAPLDVMVVRKLGAPFQPELAVGAMAPDGIRELDRAGLRAMGISEEAMARVEEEEARELRRRVALYRGDRPPLDVAGRTVLLVDDGIATGHTARAAIRWLRAQPGLARLVLAVPVAAAQTIAELAPLVDALVVVEAPEDLMTIGSWYERFDATPDEAVLEHLARAAARTDGSAAAHALARDVEIPLEDGRLLEGRLEVPAGARGIVVFAHGSGSSRHSPRNRHVAAALRAAGLGTLLMDLLTPEEERLDERTTELRFDIPRLAERLGRAIRWLGADPALAALRIGLFGASTGGGAALVAAAERPDRVAAVVSRGGRPDLAGARALARVRAPVLLLVGSLDEAVIRMNQDALAQMRGAQVRLALVPGATHLFEEPGTLDAVAHTAAAWFASHL